jgi:uncharacterized protein (DUF2147 family)
VRRAVLAPLLATLPSMLLIMLGLPASAQAPTVMGVWLTASKSAEIRLAPCADAAHGPLCGTVIRLIDPKDADGKPLVPDQVTDLHNADSKLRERKVIGMVLLYDFKTGPAPNAYEGGTIYNGENGKTYNATLGLQADGTLRLRGYVGTPLLGETQIWTRVQ